MAKKEAHHGGAWKVAYADFVTAMMALFMVLWISAQDQKILIATSQYFQRPFKSPMEDHSGIMPFNKQSDSSHEGKETEADKSSSEGKPVDTSFLNSAAADVYRLLHIDKDERDKPVDIEVTSDGLRVTLFDRARNPVFTENGADLTEWGRFMMQNLAWLVERHRFHVAIDGHTKSHLVFTRENYSGWELSADRANTARRTLVYYAVDPRLIDRVTGFSDTRPLPGERPDAEANQRITLSLSLFSEKHQRGEPPPALPLQSRSQDVTVSSTP
jgi:chemotaxis protein MotB